MRHRIEVTRRGGPRHPGRTSCPCTPCSCPPTASRRSLRRSSLPTSPRSSTRPHKLDVKLLLEADDIGDDRRGRSGLDLPSFIEVVLVPEAQPRTKPKAMQLRPARLPRRVSSRSTTPRIVPIRCSCARWSSRSRRASPRSPASRPSSRYFNADENILTRWFAVEYSMWFTQFLTGLASGRCADSARRHLEPHPHRRAGRASARGTPTT